MGLLAPLYIVDLLAPAELALSNFIQSRTHARRRVLRAGSRA